MQHSSHWDHLHPLTQLIKQALPLSPLPDKLYGVIDGTGVPMTARETAGRDGKGEDGRARTREVKLAVFFAQDKVDDDGYPVRDRASSSYIATFEPASVFGDLVKAGGIRRGAHHVRQFTIIGDGAAWIWNIATARFPEATQTVDLFHAREHLYELAGVLEFILGGQHDEWLAARLEDLDHGDIDGIRTAARSYPLEGVKKTELDKALGYFENSAPRMRYHWFRSRGLFVGSGLVEAGCKAVTGQRHHLRRCPQPQPDRVVGQLARGPQQVLRTLLPARPHRRDHIPGEHRRLRRHRRRLPAPDIGGNIGIRHTALILKCMRGTGDPGCDNDNVSPTPAQQARAKAIAAETAALGFALPGTLADRMTRCGRPNCGCHADPPRLHGPYHQWTRKKDGKTATRI